MADFVVRDNSSDHEAQPQVNEGEKSLRQRLQESHQNRQKFVNAATGNQFALVIKGICHGTGRAVGRGADLGTLAVFFIGDHGGELAADTFGKGIAAVRNVHPIEGTKAVVRGSVNAVVEGFTATTEDTLGSLKYLVEMANQGRSDLVQVGKNIGVDLRERGELERSARDCERYAAHLREGLQLALGAGEADPTIREKLMQSGRSSENADGYITDLVEGTQKLALVAEKKGQTYRELKAMGRKARQIALQGSNLQAS